MLPHSASPYLHDVIIECTLGKSFTVMALNKDQSSDHHQNESFSKNVNIIRKATIGLRMISTKCEWTDGLVWCGSN